MQIPDINIITPIKADNQNKADSPNQSRIGQRLPTEVLSKNIAIENAQDALLTSKGLPQEEKYLQILQCFQNTDYDKLLGNNEFPQEFMSLFNDIIPSWPGFLGSNGAELIVRFLNSLGIHYEQRLAKVLNSPGEKESEIAGLKQTMKAQVLELLKNTSGQKGNLLHLLNKITGQQLWHDSGVNDKGYILLEIPIKGEQKIRPAKIAIQGGRKGNKLDAQHCRVAIQTETANLGKIGVDAFFFTGKLSLNFLTEDPERLSGLVNEILGELKERLNLLGMNVASVNTKKITEDEEFQMFVQGEGQNGVDVFV